MFPENSLAQMMCGLTLALDVVFILKGSGII